MKMSLVEFKKWLAAQDDPISAIFGPPVTKLGKQPNGSDVDDHDS